MQRRQTAQNLSLIHIFLTQVSAIQSALNSFNKILLSDHIKTCVVEDIRGGKDEVVDELCKTIQKLMK